MDTPRFSRAESRLLEAAHPVHDAQDSRLFRALYGGLAPGLSALPQRPSRPCSTAYANAGGRLRADPAQVERRAALYRTTRMNPLHPFAGRLAAARRDIAVLPAAERRTLTADVDDLSARAEALVRDAVLSGVAVAGHPAHGGSPDLGKCPVLRPGDDPVRWHAYEQAAARLDARVRHVHDTALRLQRAARATVAA